MKGIVMVPPSPKRAKRDSVDDAEAAKEVSMPFALLPDELLVQIFGHLDSVSRVRMERVCLRWMHLLHDTASLRDHVKLDLAIIPFDRYGVSFYAAAGVLELLLAKYPATRRIHITVQTLLPANLPQLHGGHNYVECALECLYSRIAKHARRQARRVHVVFESVTLSMGYIEEDYIRGDAVSVLEFRNVLVQRIGLMSPMATRHAVMSAASLERRASGRIQVDLGGPAAVVALVTMLGKKDKPLTPFEEDQFRYVLSVLKQGSVHRAVSQLGQAVRRVTGVEWTPGDLGGATTMTPFVKRLITHGALVLGSFDSNGFSGRWGAWF